MPLLAESDGADVAPVDETSVADTSPTECQQTEMLDLQEERDKLAESLEVGLCVIVNMLCMWLGCAAACHVCCKLSSGPHRWTS